MHPWVRTYPVVADERGEVGSLEAVQHVEEAGAVDGVGGGEAAAREQAVLDDRRDRRVLRHLCTTEHRH